MILHNALFDSQAKAPFARYEDDHERDALLRQQARFGDPMANAVSKNKNGIAASAVTERYNEEKLKSSGMHAASVMFRGHRFSHTLQANY